MTFDLNVVGATLTIEPCAVVRIREGFTIGVGGTNPGDPPAKISALGTTDRPVIFTAGGRSLTEGFGCGAPSAAQAPRRRHN